jgi:hypothetical protein
MSTSKNKRKAANGGGIAMLVDMNGVNKRWYMKLVNIILVLFLLCSTGCGSYLSTEDKNWMIDRLYEQQAYRVIAARYYHRVHPKASWVESLAAVDNQMVIVRTVVKYRVDSEVKK